MSLSEAREENASSPMTPERWRAVDAILTAALAIEPERREAFVVDACAGDEPLHREVASLLAALASGGDDFLERPAAESLGVLAVGTPLIERVTNALAGHYAIERELAHGGMATVFLARDLRHERRVAIKVMRDDVAAAVGAERFLAEIRVTASLQHPHILPLFDSGSGAGLLWYVMPFIEGETLRSRLLREGRLPVDTAVQIVWEMAEALEYAHQHGVVHRDVKPENVLLQGGHAMVADFGIALALENAGGERLTRTGITIGTPQYMAPEQASGEREVDGRADVYALGAVLHEMLEGAVAVSQALRGEAIAPAVATRHTDVPPFIDAAVRRALSTRPDDRFPSAAAFAASVMVSPIGTGTTSGTSGRDAPDESHQRAREVDRPGAARGRTVSARAAVYAASAMLVVGLAAGWLLSRSRISEIGTALRSVTPSGEAASQGSTAATGNVTLAIVDRAGRPLRTIPADRPWTPRFSPDGKRLAYGAFGAGRSTSDLWVMDVDAGTTRRLTDDDGDSNDPQWGRDGSSLAYSVGAAGGKDVVVRSVEGGAARRLEHRPGTQFASDWLRDGSALLVTDQTADNGDDIVVQPADGTPARPYLATRAQESGARISPDGRWMAYTSDESGRPEVYLDAYPTPGRRLLLSSGGGMHPVWRGDGRELYYWHDGDLVALALGPSSGRTPPSVGTRMVLFRASYHAAPNTMYDVSPDGQRFAIVRDR